MISTSSISGGGLKKCMPTTFSGRAAALASDVMRIEEVFVAITTSRLQTCDSRPNSSRFRSGRSGAASITSSESRSSESSPAVRSRSPAALASSWLQRPRSAPLRRPSSIRTRPGSRASGNAS